MCNVFPLGFSSRRSVFVMQSPEHRASNQPVNPWGIDAGDGAGSRLKTQLETQNKPSHPISRTGSLSRSSPCCDFNHMLL